MNIRIIKNNSRANEYLKKNYIKYFSAIFFILIGIILGTIYFNTIENKEEVTKYLDTMVNNPDIEIGRFEIYTKTLYDNFVTILIIWLIGSSLIGLPVVIVYLIYKGVVLGFTLSTIISTFGYTKKMIAISLSVFSYNLIFFPFIIFIFISAFKLLQNIFIKKKGVKIELLRHTIIFIIVELVIPFITFVQAYLNTLILNVLKQ